MADTANNLDDVNSAFSDYLKSYTQASVSLLGRWPTFVPEEARHEGTLEEGEDDTFDVGPAMPSELRVNPLLGGAAEGTPLNGSPFNGSPFSVRNASRSSRRKGEQTPSEVSGVSIKEEELREKVDRLSSKIRVEVAERCRHADESMRRGVQLQALQRENAALQETVKRQGQQLEHAREVTLKLEAELRDGSKAVESADSRNIVHEAGLRFVRATYQMFRRLFRIRPTLSPAACTLS